MKSSFYREISRNQRNSFFLVLFFVLFIGFIGFVISYFSNYGYLPLVVAVVIAVLMSFFNYYNGDKIVLSLSRARPVKKSEEPYYYNITEALAIGAGIPMPKLYVIDEPAPNAFATGRDPKHASVAATTGLLGMMNRQELEGVIAHELSHIKNFDIKVMMLASVLAGILVLMIEFFWRLSFFGFGGGGGNRDRRVNPVLFIVGLLLIIFAPIIARLMQFALSRRREFLADASGAKLTRYPQGLASALEKLGDYKGNMRSASTATAHLFIVNPFKRRDWFVNLFSSHPPIDERVRRLREMG